MLKSWRAALCGWKFQKMRWSERCFNTFLFVFPLEPRRLTSEAQTNTTLNVIFAWASDFWFKIKNINFASWGWASDWVGEKRSLLFSSIVWGHICLDSGGSVKQTRHNPLIFWEIKTKCWRQHMWSETGDSNERVQEYRVVKSWIKLNSTGWSQNKGMH